MRPQSLYNAVEHDDKELTILWEAKVTLLHDQNPTHILINKRT